MVKKEPAVKGGMPNGLNAKWIKWYRDTHGVSLHDAFNEGFRRIGKPQMPVYTGAEQPSV